MPVLPFTAVQFFDVFARYNEMVWPAPLVAYGLGAIAIAAALRGGGTCNRVVAVVLAAFWLWTGIAYHWLAFTAINKAAWAFGALFVAQGALLIWFGAVAARLNFKYRHDLTGAVGILFVAYAAILYPLLGLAAGHVYPRMPMFGIAPCPVTIFTLGLLLLARPVFGAVTIVPMLWSLIGGSAAFLLNVPQDWLLLLSGPLAAALLWRASRDRG
ncbi:MAG: DUF6064 family protein [Pseudolabrys sp.]|nr:DUF6064 family protein [Pseudolabrys sp.]